MHGEGLSNDGCLDLGCLGHPVASFLEQRGDPGAGCPFEDAAEKVPPPCQHKEKSFPSVAPTPAVECAAAEEDHGVNSTTTNMVDDEDHSTCNKDSDSDSTCSEDSDSDMGRSVVRRQSTLAMHWAQQAFQDMQ